MTAGPIESSMISYPDCLKNQASAVRQISACSHDLSQIINYQRKSITHHRKIFCQLFELLLFGLDHLWKLDFEGSPEKNKNDTCDVKWVKKKSELLVFISH